MQILPTLLFSFSLSLFLKTLFIALYRTSIALFFFLSKLFLKKCFLEPSKNLFNNNYCKLLATIFFKNFKIVSGTTFFCQALSFEDFIMKYIHVHMYLNFFVAFISTMPECRVKSHFFVFSISNSQYIVYIYMNIY